MYTQENEIRKIVEYQNSVRSRSAQKTQAEMNQLVFAVLEAINRHSYQFDDYKPMVLNQDGNKRYINQYADWSVEFVLCNYLKRSLDRVFRIRYANRNDYMHILFDIVSVIKDMQDFVIVKYDFKNYFNSLSSEYIYYEYVIGSNMPRSDKDVFLNFVKACPRCFAGLSTSNVMAEIIAQEFDMVLVRKFAEKGLIFNKRYVDDGILVFNQYITEQECQSILGDAIKSVFQKPDNACRKQCDVKMNQDKFQYINRRSFIAGNLKSFDFLGYKFDLSLGPKNKLEIMYGLTDKKIRKYAKQIEQLVKEYVDEPNVELLRQRILAFCSRTVYQLNRYNSRIWKVKGFISNYSELRFHKGQLNPVTETFLKSIVYDTCFRLCPELPYFLKNANSDETPYQLYNNLLKNRTLLLHDTLGIDKATLIKQCQRIGITTLPKKSYDYYTREYLIKVKVGH